MTRSPFFAIAALISFCITLISSVVARADVYDLPTPVAIQGRTNKIDQSFGLGVGYLPTDSFNRGFPLSLDYSFYFKPYFAWDVITYSYNFNRETQLKQDFLNLGVNAQNIGFGGVLDYPTHIIMSGIIYTPLYGKNLLFNKTIVHSETSFYLGAGTIVFNKVGHVPAIAPGLQGRFFISPQSAIKIYLRQYFFNDAQLGLTGITDLGIGFETQFDFLSRKGSDESYEEESE